VGADNLGMTVDVTSGIRLNSNTPATSDLNQISPLLTFRSNN